MSANIFNIVGLTDEQVLLAARQYGKNRLHFQKGNEFLNAIKRIARDPMIILLLVAATIYFLNGQTGDGFFLVAAIVFIASISFYQFRRSKNALDKLKDFSQPYCKVIRNGKLNEIKMEDLVVGDSLMVEEGSLITADGIIKHSNDFSVNESLLTGESLPVFKDRNTRDNFIYSGTSVASGLAIATITEIGNNTRLGKIGLSMVTISEERTPLEMQIANFVKKMAFSGAVVFILVWAINYSQSQNLLSSLLLSLTLAMSILPEEIPVAFTTFMALGAWRLMKMDIVVKQMKTVETLGSATVICIDKTGTITENKMSLSKLYLLSSDKLFQPAVNMNESEHELLNLAMWASEPIPFDPMEVALHQAYKEFEKYDERPAYKLIHEYPLAGASPMMTHIFENEEGHRIIAAKGAPEALMNLSHLTISEQGNLDKAIRLLATDGYRILGVCTSTFAGNTFPLRQQDFHFRFVGLVAFYDPPKPNIQNVLKDFYNAGISVKIITGDYGVTTTAIARQIAFRDFEKTISGPELMKLTDDKLSACVMNTAIFTRMFPEAKLRVINALKSQGQIVAMTGDGVNDGPALKAAHIGIAMGKRGTEIAKQAASLILLNDDLSKMVNAIAMGRKIYSNLKKAIQYIISIHIPIILTVFIPLALGWIYPNIFSPIHIIFLELIMGPTCSIIYENEPMEKNAMIQKPKVVSITFFSWKELSISIIQGLVITAGVLLVYQYAVYNSYNEALTRTLTFTTLIASNIFLTLVNRSFIYSVITSLTYKNNLVLMIISLTIALVGLILYIPPLTAFFEFETLVPVHLSLCIIVGFISVMWFEILKLANRRKKIPDVPSEIA